MYTVRKGDNIWNIANSFGIRADLIYRWNGIDRESFIFPGDELVIYLKK
jgi:LysM repeat protein